MSKAFREARDFLFTYREDYATAYEQFRWPVLDEFNWALNWFDAIARSQRRDQLALWVANENGTDTTLTFAQLSERSSQVANYLRELGVHRGTRILIMLGNVPPLWETMLAAMKLGAVIVPSTGMLTTDDLVDRIARAGVSHVVSTADYTAKFNGVGGAETRIAVGDAGRGWHRYEESHGASADFRPEGITRGSDPMQLYFTSGTTSKPKLVRHTHASYPAGHLSTMYWLGLQPGDIHCNVSSPGWAKHAWSCFFAPWNAEATVFVLNQARFSARGLLETIVRCGVTTLCAPPTVWRMLVLERLREYKGKLREVASAGEPLNPEIITQVREAWGLTIRDGYGQTETTALIANSPEQPVKPGSMGRALPGYRFRLLDVEQRDAREGELCLRLDPRPVGLMPGYQGDDGGVLPIDGTVFHTGDVMARDSDGYFTFVGRTDDVFKASDYRISPFELESILIEHADVVECAVVPAPDPIRLAVPKAFVVLRPGVMPSRDVALSIFRHSRKLLARYKRIQRLQFGDLPKTISGKIRRVELRQQEKTRTGADRPLMEFWEEDFPELQ